MSNKNLNWFISFWIVFTCLNLYVSQVVPEKQAKIHENKPPLVKQNLPAYMYVLNKVSGKIENIKCTDSTDKENNTFFDCSDGTKISMINWTRGERKGVVTREYDKNGNLIQIYGHPDDVY